MSDLNPCPFCGDPDTPVLVPNDFGKRSWFRVQCYELLGAGCGAIGPGASWRAEATRLWNERPTPRRVPTLPPNPGYASP